MADEQTPDEQPASDEPKAELPDPALEGSASAVPTPEADEAKADVAQAAADEQVPVETDSSSTDSAPATEPEPEPEPEPKREPDPVRDPLVAKLRDLLGDAVVGAEVEGQDIWVRVAPTSWKAAFEACRDHLGMDYFCFLSGLDWLPNPGMSAEKVWDPDETTPPIEIPDQYATGVAGGDTRFQIFARLSSTKTHVGITLKADLDGDNPSVETVSDVYRGADWHERETWEMYGFDFVGHPSLRHLYLPGEFEGYPLRKDFPLLAREVKPWPGLVDLEPMPGDDEPAVAEGGE